MYKFHKERGLLNDEGDQILQLVKTHCSEKERVRLGKLLADTLNNANTVSVGNEKGSAHPQSIKTISDGFGSVWAKKCPDCDIGMMVVVRPGKAQCDNCG